MSALPPQLLQFKQKLAEKPSDKHAWAIVQEYMSFFGLEAIQQDLWQMLVATLSNEEMEDCNIPRRRHDLIFFYEFTMLFMEAANAMVETSLESASPDLNGT